jgi:hypothetical protein
VEDRGRGLKEEGGREGRGCLSLVVDSIGYSAVSDEMNHNAPLKREMGGLYRPEG